MTEVDWNEVSDKQTKIASQRLLSLACREDAVRIFSIPIEDDSMQDGSLGCSGQLND